MALVVFGSCSLQQAKVADNRVVCVFTEAYRTKIIGTIREFSTIMSKNSSFGHLILAIGDCLLQNINGGGSSRVFTEATKRNKKHYLVFFSSKKIHSLF